MKNLLIIVLLAVSGMAFAQNKGDVKAVDGQKFEYNGSSWVHTALTDSDKVSKDYSSVYKDKKWEKWYSSGDATLKKILDLGPNVVFQYKGSDGQYHAFAVYGNKKAMKAGLAAAAGGATAAAAAAGGTAVAGTAAGVGAAAAATGGTILGVSATTAAVVGGAVVAGAVIVDNNNDSSSSSP